MSNVVFKLNLKNIRRRNIMKIIVKKSNAHEPYSFSFVDNYGASVIRSENYAAKRSALNGIASVKKNCVDDSRYEMKESKNGKFFFNLKALNGQIVATSTLFATEEIRNEAVLKLKSEAHEALQEEAEVEA